MTASALAAPPPEPAPPKPRVVWQVRDGGDVLGAVVIDELVAGRACGGVRISPLVTCAELGELAAVMTLKFAFFGIACGGAKAGLRVAAGAGPAERERRARAFGRALAPLVACGTYIPGTDLGCAERDLWEVLAGAGLPSGLPPPRTLLGTSETASYSGRSTAIAALAALALRGDSAAGATLAVAGYGRVGAACAADFVAAGGRLVAASTELGAVLDPAGLDLARLEQARALHGDAAPLHYGRGQQIAPADVLALPVDVLAPCATTHMLDATSWRWIRARVVAAGANAAVTAEAEAGLAAAGVTVVPDFVANAGGILVSHFWPLPLSSAAIDLLLARRFRTIVERLLARAAAEGITPARLARSLAARNLAQLCTRSAGATRHERLIARLGRSRLRDVLPAAAVTHVVARLARRLGPPLD